MTQFEKYNPIFEEETQEFSEYILHEEDEDFDPERCQNLLREGIERFYQKTGLNYESWSQILSSFVSARLKELEDKYASKE